MVKYENQVTYRYFQKMRKCAINDVSEGDVVHITVRSPLHYGIREWSFYGRIVRITRCFFSIVQYFEASVFGGVESNYCTVRLAESLDANQKKYAKRWSKDSLISIYAASFVDKVVTRENRHLDV